MTLKEFHDYYYKGEDEDLIIHYWIETSSGRDLRIDLPFTNLDHTDPAKINSNIVEVYTSYEVNEYPKRDNRIEICVLLHVWVY